MEIDSFLVQTLTREGYINEVRRRSYDKDISYKDAREEIERERAAVGFPKGYTYSTVRNYLCFIGGPRRIRVKKSQKVLK